MREMIKKTENLVKFFFIMFLFLFLAFIVHISVNDILGENVFSNKILESYLLNFVLGYLSFIGLLVAKRRYLPNLGYIFMYTSLVKFLIFYIIFKPYYNINGDVEIAEFLTILIPYSIALYLEIYFITKKLKA